MVYAYVFENIVFTEKRDNQQLFLLIKDFEIEDDNLFIDKDSDTSRPELKQLIEVIKPQSRLAIRSVTDLADTFLELKSVFQKLTKKQVILCSCEEPFLSGEDYLDYLIGFSKLFVYYDKKKQKMGFEQAVKNGLVGRPQKSKEIEQALNLYKSGNFKISQIEAITGISKTTLYRYLKIDKG